MISVYIIVCLLSTPVSDCNRKTAIDWFETEPQASLMACMREGELIIARRQLLDDQTYLKVFCRMPGPSVGMHG